MPVSGNIYSRTVKFRGYGGKERSSLTLAYHYNSLLEYVGADFLNSLTATLEREELGWPRCRPHGAHCYHHCMQCKEASAEFRVISYHLHSPRTSKSCKVVTLATMSPLVFSLKLRWSGEHYFGY